MSESPNITLNWLRAITIAYRVQLRQISKHNEGLALDISNELKAIAGDLSDNEDLSQILNHLALIEDIDLAEDGGVIPYGVATASGLLGHDRSQRVPDEFPMSPLMREQMDRMLRDRDDPDDVG